MIGITWLKTKNILANVERMSEDKFILYRESVYKNLDEIENLAKYIIKSGKLGEVKTFAQNELYNTFYNNILEMVNDKRVSDMYDECNRYIVLIDNLKSSSLLSSKESFIEFLKEIQFDKNKNNLGLLKKDLEAWFNKVSKNIKGLPQDVSFKEEDLKLFIDEFSKENRQQIMKKIEVALKINKQANNKIKASDIELEAHNCLSRMQEIVDMPKICCLTLEQCKNISSVFLSLLSFLDKVEDETLKEEGKNLLSKQLKNEPLFFKFCHEPANVEKLQELIKNIVEKYREQEKIECDLEEVDEYILQNPNLSNDDIRMYYRRSSLNNVFKNVSFTSDKLVEAINKGMLDEEYDSLKKVIDGLFWYGRPSSSVHFDRDLNWQKIYANVDGDLELYFDVQKIKNDQTEEKGDLLELLQILDVYNKKKLNRIKKIEL